MAERVQIEDLVAQHLRCVPLEHCVVADRVRQLRRRISSSGDAAVRVRWRYSSEPAEVFHTWTGRVAARGSRLMVTWYDVGDNPDDAYYRGETTVFPGVDVVYYEVQELPCLSLASHPPLDVDEFRWNCPETFKLDNQIDVQHFVSTFMRHCGIDNDCQPLVRACLSILELWASAMSTTPDWSLSEQLVRLGKALTELSRAAWVASDSQYSSAAVWETFVKKDDAFLNLFERAKRRPDKVVHLDAAYVRLQRRLEEVDQRAARAVAEAERVSVQQAEEIKGLHDAVNSMLAERPEPEQQGLRLEQQERLWQQEQQWQQQQWQQQQWQQQQWQQQWQQEQQWMQQQQELEMWQQLQQGQLREQQKLLQPQSSQDQNSPTMGQKVALRVESQPVDNALAEFEWAELDPVSDEPVRAGFAKKFVHEAKTVAGPDDMKYPFHSKPVGVADVEFVRQRMLPERRERFDAVWESSFPAPDVFTPKEERSTTFFSRADAQTLCKDGIAERAPDGAVPTAVPFTVLEDKMVKVGNRRQRRRLLTKRRRFILWPKQLNSFLKEQGYKADVPLQHISCYLSGVRSRGGGTRDVQCGFYHIPIPEDRRFLFRFVDDEGVVWQLTRLPMGLRTAPEIMHSVTATLAGHKDYALPQYRAKGVDTDVWIDNVRVHGDSDEVTAALAAFDARCVEARVALNDDDAEEGERYTFLGVVFDHHVGKVSLGEKLHAKFAAAEVAELTVGELERWMGRFQHAVAVLQIDLAEYWWLIKTVRRRLSAINRGTLTRQHGANLSQQVRREFEELMRRCVQNEPAVPPDLEAVPAATVFTDATMESWGAVYVDRVSREVRVAGGKFKSRAPHIGAAETRAVAAAFAAFPVDGKHIDLVIDNTSTVAAVSKGRAASHSINEELRRVLDWKSRKTVSLKARYIASASNPADAPSRQQPFTKQHLQAIGDVLATG